jgi:hypothetical protein
MSYPTETLRVSICTVFAVAVEAAEAQYAQKLEGELESVRAALAEAQAQLAAATSLSVASKEPVLEEKQGPAPAAEPGDDMTAAAAAWGIDTANDEVST